MNLKRSATFTAIIALLSFGLIACEPTTEGEPPKRALTGEIDPRVVGTWKTEDKSSTYMFKDDGTYNTESKVSTPGGPVESKTNGQWRVDADEILVTSPSGAVVPYALKLDGDRLSMTGLGSLKNETVLVRASESEPTASEMESPSDPGQPE